MGDESETEWLEEFEGLESVTLDEAISILGEQTRMEIIVELGKAWDEERHQQKAIGFSELMDSVGVSDSGRFNYHLDKLVGTFVTKIEEGYMLLNPGRKLYQIMVSGTLTERETEIRLVADDCASCDGDIEATLRGDNMLFFKCVDCGTGHGALPFSPRGFEYRTEEEALEAAYRAVHAEIRLARQNVCSACHGKMETELITEHSDTLASMIRGEVLASMKCKICNDYYYGDLSRLAVTTDEVEQFLADNGRDPALVQDWQKILIAADESQTIVQEDPLRVRLTFAVDTEKLDITVGEELQVVSSERSAR